MAESFNRKLFTGVCFGSDLLRFMTIKKKGKERKTKFRQSAMHLKLGLKLGFFICFLVISRGKTYPQIFSHLLLHFLFESCAQK